MIWKCNTMKPRKITESIFVLLILCTMGFIFWNSLLNVEKSIQASDTTAHAVQQIVDPQKPDTIRPSENPNATRYPKVNYFITHIRSAAHVIEFFVLGLELAILSLLHEKPTFRSLYLLFSTGVMTAVLDESLQFLNDRGPEVNDILKDVAGATTAMALVLLLYGIGLLLRVYMRKRIEHS